MEQNFIQSFKYLTRSLLQYRPFHSFRLPDIDSSHIEKIKQLAAGTPQEYCLTPHAPVINTALGQVQIGSFLCNQVRRIISPQQDLPKFNFTHFL